MTRVPELRFVGFSEEWEKETLGNLNKFSKGKGYSKNDLSDEGYQIFLYGQMYTDYQMQVNELKTHVKTLKKNSVLSNGNEVLIPSSGETALDLARASHMSISDVILGGDLNILIPCEKILPHFEALTLSTEKNRKNLSTLAQGKSVVHLYGTDIKTDVISYPDINEQEKIGDLFSKIDQLIESQQELVDQTIAFKKSMLQKMFPKKDSLVPDFRFKGFENNWKRYSFKDIYGNYESGNRLPKSQLKEGKIPYILAKTNDNGVYMRIDKNTLDYSGNKMKLFKPNSITFSIDNPDAIFIQKEYFYTSNIMRVFHNEDHNEYHTIFFKTQFQKTTQGFGWGNKFSGPVALESKLYVPVKNNSINFEEIELIGKFINKLDEKIAREEKLLDAYKMMKKSLLQKMFV